jgi:hypothetical protein
MKSTWHQSLGTIRPSVDVPVALGRAETVEALKGAVLVVAWFEEDRRRRGAVEAGP